MADRRETTSDDTSKAVATYGKILFLPTTNNLLIHCLHNFSMVRVERLMSHAIHKICTNLLRHVVVFKVAQFARLDHK